MRPSSLVQTIYVWWFYTGVQSFPLTYRWFLLSSSRSQTALNGWFENLFPSLDDAAADNDRRLNFPEQYPATYELSETLVKSDKEDAKTVRPLLKQTMLEERPLHVAYDASKEGWSPGAFHGCVDGKGAAIVLASCKTPKSGKQMVVGGYNPKGWSSNGSARPSVAAFLFYSVDGEPFQKLQKVGGGGLACGRDDPDFGVSFGPDGLVIGLQAGRERLATSKLGPYYERGPGELPTLFFEAGGAVQLDSLKVLVGTYGADEKIPYNGAVLDMTSG